MKRRLRLVGVAATVDEFGRAHALDLAAQSQQRHREQVVREARVDAVAEEAGAARLAGLRDPLPQRSGNQRGVMEDAHARVDDILPGAQRRLDVRHVGFGLHHVGSEVGDRVGLSRQHAVRIARGDDARARPTHDLAHVAAVLRRIVDHDTRDFERRMAEQALQHRLPDEARSPDDHAMHAEDLLSSRQRG